MTHTIRAFGPLALKHGCDAGDAGCFGPLGEYRTLFGSEVRMLGPHLAVALVAGLVVAAVVAWLARDAASRWPWAIAIFAFVASGAFLALAAVVGAHVDY